jgi:hypothetical protein
MKRLLTHTGGGHLALLALTAVLVVGAPALAEIAVRGRPSRGMWIDPAALAALPASGPAWERLRAAARGPIIQPRLDDQNDPANGIVLAKALVAARLGDATLRREVQAAIIAVMGTEAGGRTLSLGRKLVTYVIAADLVGLPPDEDAKFCAWLRQVLDEKLDGKTLRTTHEKRPNNWGTHAGASRTAVAIYLGMNDELARSAQVFRGWLGDRGAYAGFEYGDLSWQFDAAYPVGINPVGATRDGHSIDGVLPDDQRRHGPFAWPPPHENYVYEALQGALAQAVLLDRAGYHDVWSWSDKALLRAYLWLQEQASFRATGDDVWQLPVIDHFYGTSLWNGSAVIPGKNVGWTDWTHAAGRAH